MSFLWRHFPLLERHPSTLKHVSNQQYDLMEEYQSDDERHVVLQSPTNQRNTPPWKIRTVASITTYLRLRRDETQISHTTPSHTPLPSTNITATCSKQEAPLPYPV
ncbi:hypothetical protein TNCV_1108421 [Trichonephila clavipes]|nr:hypothetical protein TNCV_1108421 [Trichonephila clavipes]